MEHTNTDVVDIININNVPGFMQLYPNSTSHFGMFERIFESESHQHDDSSGSHHRWMFSNDPNSVTYDPDPHSESSKVEYILLSVFGSIVGIFLICQIVIHTRSCSNKNACRVGKRGWWSIRKKGKVPRSFQCGLDKDTTVWAHHYEPYPMAPCRRGLVYSGRNVPCTSSSNVMFSDGYKSSSGSDSTLDTPSNMVDTVGSRSCQSCGSSSTVFLLNPKHQCNHRYMTRTDTVIQVQTLSYLSILV